MYFTILLAITIILALLLIYYIGVPNQSEQFIDLAWNTRTTPVNLFQETEARDTRYYSGKGSIDNRTKPLTTMIEPYPMPKNAQNYYIVPNYAESMGSYF